VQADLTTSSSLTVSAVTTTTLAAGGAGAAGAGSTGNVTTGKVTKTFSSLAVGIPKIISAADLEASGTHMTEISITVKNRAVSVSITIEKLDQKPADVAVDVAGKSYRYIKITKENLDDENIQEGKIKFKVEKSWINANSINVATIALYRYANTWNKLDTAKLSEDSSYVYFEATTPGFSYFAISGEAIAPTTTIPGATTTIPTTTTLPGMIPKGYEWTYWVMAVVVIVAVVFLSWKFLKKKKE
jgi:PGF-pre-PGF domain-containing protein